MEINKDLISVIIPVYNVAEYIDRCVNSLLAQTYNNIEIILINDGSKDNSGEVCHRLADLYIGKVKVIDQENKGVSAARNAGLDIANGKYIVFVDADDWVDERYVEKLYNSILESESDISICAHLMDYDSGKRVYMSRISNGIYSIEEYIKIQGISMPNIWVSMYKKAIIDSYGLRFDSYLRKGEDVLFICSYMSKCEKISAIDDPLYHYYQRSNSACGEYRTYVVLGSIKVAYLYSKQQECWQNSQLPSEVYQKHFDKLWIAFIPRQARYISDKRNHFKAKNKRVLLKQVFVECNTIEKISNLSSSKKTFFEKILIRLVKKERINILLSLGWLWDFLSRIKKVIENA